MSEPSSTPEIIRNRLYTNTKAEGDGCIVWLGRKKKRYGQIKILGKWRGTHVVAWELDNGPVPPGLWVLHRCDMPMCINPEHLYLGTAGDNLRDAYQRSGKARTHRKMNSHYLGEGHFGSKLKAADVIRLRALHTAGNLERHLEAKALGVAPSTIDSAVHGETWRHLSGAVRRPHPHLIQAAPELLAALKDAALILDVIDRNAVVVEGALRMAGVGGSYPTPGDVSYDAKAARIRAAIIKAEASR